MTEELISFSTAKLAKEKGLPVFEYMGWKTKFYHPRTKNMFAYGRTGRVDINTMYYAPTQSLLQKWLREKYKIHLRITQCFFHNLDTMGFQVETEYMGIGNKPKYDTHHAPFKTYEEALEAGLIEALKLI